MKGAAGICNRPHIVCSTGSLDSSDTEINVVEFEGSESTSAKAHPQDTEPLDGHLSSSVRQSDGSPASTRMSRVVTSSTQQLCAPLPDPSPLVSQARRFSVQLLQMTELFSFHTSGVLLVCSSFPSLFVCWLTGHAICRPTWHLADVVCFDKHVCRGG